jgi:LPXTG-motif cell wall-anchored protein
VQVQDNTVTRNDPPAPTVLSAAAQPAALPLTGGDVAGLTAIGVVLVAGGAVVVTRRRTAAA